MLKQFMYRLSDENKPVEPITGIIVCPKSNECIDKKILILERFASSIKCW